MASGRDMSRGAPRAGSGAQVPCRAHADGDPRACVPSLDGAANCGYTGPVPALSSPVAARCEQARRAESLWSEVTTLRQRLHEPGLRDLHRELLAGCIGSAERSLAGLPDGGIAPRSLLSVLLQAYAAQAEDARYGAGQLSRGAQRAPSVADCEEGWRRVTEIIETSERSAQRADQLASELATPRAEFLARAARDAARQARNLLVERNHAYTFHADPHFSFGEGWYVAAAGVLNGIPIQIEPHQAQTAQAEFFLKCAGLGSKLVDYRSRPRANKALPALIASEFRADPTLAQTTLRAAFLGGEPVPNEVAVWLRTRLSGHDWSWAVLVWVRYGDHQPERNTRHTELEQLCALVRASGMTPILVGDALRDGPRPPGAIDLTLFWKDALFQGLDMRRAQLHFFECLGASYGVVAQMGVTTAGMDGPALMGMPTLYISEQPNVRLGQWVGAVPHYVEVLRDGQLAETVLAHLERWRELRSRRLDEEIPTKVCAPAAPRQKA